MTIALVSVFVIGGALWLDHTGRRTHEELRALVVSGYYASAARGEVAQPASEPGSVRATAKCELSIPFIVRVKTSAGEKRTYFAQGHPQFNLRAESWAFKDARETVHE